LPDWLADMIASADGIEITWGDWRVLVTRPPARRSTVAASTDFPPPQGAGEFPDLRRRGSFPDQYE
jgi:hypothetical protein